MIKNKSIRRIILLGLVLVAALLVLTTRGYLNSANYSGLIVVPDSTVVRILPDGPAADTDIQIGDRILSLDDRQISNFSEYINIVKNNEIADQSIPVEVQRQDGKTYRFPITIVSYPVFHASLFGPYCGMLLLIFGLYVFMKKAEDPSAGIYLSLTCCLFVLLTLTNHLIKQFSSPFISLFWGLSFMLLVPVTLHFCLVFPDPKPIIKKRPWDPVMLYIIPLVFMALLTRAVLEMDWALKYGIDSGDKFKRIISLFANYFFFVVLPSAAVFLARVLHSYKRADSLEQKKQFQIILIGAMSTLIMAFPVISGQALLFTHPEIFTLWPSWCFSLLYGTGVFTTMLIPAAMAIAIHKYRLWDVDTAINRSLTYMGVGAILFALYFLIVALLSRGLGLTTKPGSHLTILVFTLTAAIISEPLRHFVKRLIDRRLNREANEYGQTLSAFSRKLSTIHHLSELTQGLCETLSQALDLRNIAVIIQDRKTSGKYQLAAVEGIPDYIAEETLQWDDAVVELVQTHQGPFAPQELTSSAELPDKIMKGIYIAKKTRACLIVPIREGHKLLGWISLGRKKADRLFTTEDRQLLEILADQAAIAIINTIAFDKIDTLNSGLQDKITKVEEQHDEIQRLQENLLQENLALKKRLKDHYDSTKIIGAGHRLRQPEKKREKAGTTTDKGHSQVINEIECDRLQEALSAAKGNKSQAARSLGLKRSTFFNKLKKYDLLT
ncbi:MAG: GAF domain-containing protein [bacterium]|nr:GAF domain-containing protein [bacterium]